MILGKILLKYFIALILITCIIVGVQASESYDFVCSWGSEGTGNGQFNFPTDVAASPSGSIYIADHGNNRIQKFTGNGEFLTKWGTETDDSYVYPPWGVAVDNGDLSHEEFVYVSASTCVQKFTDTGGFRTKWGSSGSGDGQFWDVRGICVVDSKYVYVVDTGNNRIQKFSTSGDFKTQWGGTGVLHNPQGIAVSRSGFIYLADQDNERIVMYDASGKPVTEWGSYGSGEGQFLTPCAVAVDDSGFVYVADSNRNCILKFTSDGTFVTEWGSRGAGNGEFGHPGPYGIAVDKSGFVYAVDSVNNRIQKFEMMSVSETSSTVQTQPEGTQSDPKEEQATGVPEKTTGIQAPTPVSDEILGSMEDIGDAMDAFDAGEIDSGSLVSIVQNAIDSVMSFINGLLSANPS